MTLEELNVFVTTQANVGMEAYYWWCTGLMIIIHVGFLMYEVGATRMQNAVSSGVKNLLAFAFMIPTFWLFGWWIYLAFPGGFVPIDLEGYGAPWNVSMGPMLSDQATGVFWAAFTLFACTTASIFSGAVIERIRISAFVFLATILGSVVWILGASWGWHPDGWLVTGFGFHDVAAAGCVHTIAGLFAFGVLLNLGPRIGKYNDDGSANHIAPHNLPFTVTGLMLIIVGFWGFLMACLIVPGEAWSWYGDKFATIYGTPITLSALSFNILMGISGGIIGAWAITKDPFWMMSGALAGIIAVASGLDLYWPPLAFIIAFVAGGILKPCATWLENRGIDDAVGAVTVHGTIGLYGLIMLGIWGSGYPAAQGEGAATITLYGQIIGAVVFFLVVLCFLSFF